MRMLHIAAGSVGFKKLVKNQINGEEKTNPKDIRMEKEEDKLLFIKWLNLKG